MNKINIIDSTYRRQDSCRNCDLVFCMTHYDDANEYFCHRDQSYRPPCGSVAMDEWENRPMDFSVSHRNRFVWDVWSKDRGVCETGICKYHRKNEWVRTDIFFLSRRDGFAEAINVVMEYINGLFEDGKFEVCDLFFPLVEVAEIDVSISIAILSISFAGKSNLKNREEFYQMVYNKLKDNGEDADKILSNLR